MPLYLENYYIIRPDDQFMTSYKVMDNGTVITLTYTFYSWPVLFPNLINILDMIVQLAAIHFVWTGKMFRKTKFFMLLFIFSTTISWRTFTFIICTTLASSIGTGVIYRITTYISLYTDAITDYFSMQMIFLMSLNRCLSFTRDTWNSRIFGGYRYIPTVIVSGVLAIISAISGLITSKVYRHFNYAYGFVDYGYSVGIRAEISRLYYTFQVSSVFCYAILYYYMRKQNKTISNQSANTNQGEKKVFVQLCVAAVLEVPYYPPPIFLSSRPSQPSTNATFSSPASIDLKRPVALGTTPFKTPQWGY
ncbi:hypothetical protein CRE_15057 [Caenorhabditis remanei]|uniref:Serpentine receptor class gamma n=1 Tax=Caenorhabditis remanei TaxID=31234 RepID=E3NME4_CAERE|nr:hypothetical protein CRE_15057 [Caenorhabditis remanei]